MSLGLAKCGIGIFASREDTESALHQLRDISFPMDRISVVARDPSEDDQIAESESKFVRGKTIDGLTKGALTVGTLGSIAGILVGLSTLAVPGIGPVAVAGAKVAVAGMFAGGYYGTAAGGIIGAFLGNGLSKEQARIYSDRLAQGDYLVIVEGSEDQIHQAESILAGKGIQDWAIYSTT